MGEAPQPRPPEPGPEARTEATDAPGSRGPQTLADWCCIGLGSAAIIALHLIRPPWFPMPDNDGFKRAYFYYVAVVGTIGCVAGYVIGKLLEWLFRRSKEENQG
jgi:hypothetical protein